MKDITKKLDRQVQLFVNLNTTVFRRGETNCQHFFSKYDYGLYLNLVQRSGRQSGKILRQRERVD